MYKTYRTEDYLQTADECSERIRKLLQTRYDELEEMRDAINDRYPFEDLDLRCAAVDYEEALIDQLLRHLDQCAALQKEKIREHKNGN